MAFSGGTLVTLVAGVAAIVGGLVLLLGLLTPVAATVSAVAYLVEGLLVLLSAGEVSRGRSIASLEFALVSAALILTGPGAFSLDARLFGRREIIIPDSWRPPQL